MNIDSIKWSQNFTNLISQIDSFKWSIVYENENIIKNEILSFLNYFVSFCDYLKAYSDLLYKNHFVFVGMIVDNILKKLLFKIKEFCIQYKKDFSFEEFCLLEWKEYNWIMFYFTVRKNANGGSLHDVLNYINISSKNYLMNKETFYFFTKRLLIYTEKMKNDYFVSKIYEYVKKMLISSDFLEFMEELRTLIPISKKLKLDNLIFQMTSSDEFIINKVVIINIFEMLKIKLFKINQLLKKEEKYDEDKYLNNQLNYYKKFVYICKKYENLKFVPNQGIDDIWHVHILYSEYYYQDCFKYTNKISHHYPPGLSKELDDLFYNTQEKWKIEYKENLVGNVTICFSHK